MIISQRKCRNTYLMKDVERVRWSIFLTTELLTCGCFKVHSIFQFFFFFFLWGWRPVRAWSRCDVAWRLDCHWWITLWGHWICQSWPRDHVWTLAVSMYPSHGFMYEIDDILLIYCKLRQVETNGKRYYDHCLDSLTNTVGGKKE